MSYCKFIFHTYLLSQHIPQRAHDGLNLIICATQLHDDIVVLCCAYQQNETNIWSVCRRFYVHKVFIARTYLVFVTEYENWKLHNFIQIGFFHQLKFHHLQHFLYFIHGTLTINQNMTIHSAGECSVCIYSNRIYWFSPLNTDPCIDNFIYRTEFCD